MVKGLPSGTVTFLFTDIEGSTGILRDLGDGYSDLLDHHHRLLRDVWARHRGVDVMTEGDAFFVAFARTQLPERLAGGVEAVGLRPSGKGADPTEKVVIGVLDSGLAGGWDNANAQRPDLLGTDAPDLERISGSLDLASRPLGDLPADKYLDPVAGHGTFIAGIIEQLTHGCTITVDGVFEPEGDVGTLVLAIELWKLMTLVEPDIVNCSFGGTGRDILFGLLIELDQKSGVIFVAAAGNEGSCVEQYPAALPVVIGVAALGPAGPGPRSNYGPWVDACAPGTDLTSSFFAKFNGDMPPSTDSIPTTSTNGRRGAARHSPPPLSLRLSHARCGRDTPGRRLSTAWWVRRTSPVFPTWAPSSTTDLVTAIRLRAAGRWLLFRCALRPAKKSLIHSHPDHRAAPKTS